MPSASHISVVIPTYNRARLVQRAVANALPQLQDGDEIIVVDDGSTDDTAQVVGGFGPPVRYLSIPHGGAGAARNAGIQAATKPLLAFLDSDDLWFPDKLAMQRSFMARNPEVLFCFSNFGVQEASGEEIRFYMQRWHSKPLVWEDVLGPGVPFSTLADLPPGRADFQVHRGNLFLAELEADYVLTSSMIARREEAGDALYFAEDVPTWEDWECFGRLAKKGLAAYLDCETAWQCGHAGMRLSDTKPHRRAEAALRIMPRVWGSDADFMAKHGDRYERVRVANHLTRAKYFIRAGRNQEARAEIAAAGSAPLTWRLLSLLPGSVTSYLFSIRNFMRRSD